MDLASIARSGAFQWPDRVAVYVAAGVLTFDELDRSSDYLASALIERGIEAGDKVALMCPNLPVFPVAYFGILKAGSVVVPLNILLKRREVAYHLQDSEARALLCFSGSQELPMGVEATAGFDQVAQCDLLIGIGSRDPFPQGTALIDGLISGVGTVDYPEIDPQDTAVILYTSGTTGRPKGAELSHGNLLSNAEATASMCRFTTEDVVYVPLPLFHSFGQSVLMNSGMVSGAALVLEARFEPQAAIDAMCRYQVTVFGGVPTMYWGLLQTAKDPSKDQVLRSGLRLCLSGGASLPLAVLKEFEERFEVPILEGYGLSETAPVASFNHLDKERKPGSVGTPIAGVEMQIVNDEDQPVAAGETGEVVIRGSNVMKGYYRRPEANAEALRGGWFHTGDVGWMDQDGYFYIVDRTKDMIIRGGFNVYPREIEEVLLEHPEVSLAAVIGVPDPRLGEEIVALVVAKSGDAKNGIAVQPSQLITWCRDRLAAYKYPRRVEVRDQLPLSATGKILKRELRAEMAAVEALPD